MNCSFCALEVLELEDPCIVAWQILIWIPWARPEGAKTTVSLESCTGGHVKGCVYLIRKLCVVFFLPFAVSP